MVVGVEDGQSMGLPTPETHCLHEAAMRRLYGIDQWLCSSDFKSSVINPYYFLTRHHGNMFCRAK